MKKWMMLALAAATLSVSHLHASDAKIGFVNFKACVEKSKQGQQEKNAFEALKKQMTGTLEEADKRLEELTTKLEDQDYMDGLSPTAEEELKGEYQQLTQEFARYQNQYYQFLNQANYKMLQAMHDEVSKAAEQVREELAFSLVLNEDSTFAFAPALDITENVIEKMDKLFELESEVADQSTVTSESDA